MNAVKYTIGKNHMKYSVNVNSDFNMTTVWNSLHFLDLLDGIYFIIGVYLHVISLKLLETGTKLLARFP